MLTSLRLRGCWTSWYYSMKMLSATSVLPLAKQTIAGHAASFPDRKRSGWGVGWGVAVREDRPETRCAGGQWCAATQSYQRKKHFWIEFSHCWESIRIKLWCKIFCTAYKLTLLMMRMVLFYILGRKKKEYIWELQGNILSSCNS